MRLREELIKERKGKVILNIRILNRRYHITRKHLLMPLLFVVLFLINRKYFVFGALTVFSAVFSYYHDKINRTPIDFNMPLFLGIMITRQFGFLYTFIFYILSDLLPGLLAGRDMEAQSFIFLGWQLIVCSLVLLFPSVDIILLGVILVIVETIGSVFINMTRGFPGIVAFASSLLSMLARIGYFLSLGTVLKFIFRLI